MVCVVHKKKGNSLGRAPHDIYCIDFVAHLIKRDELGVVLVCQTSRRCDVHHEAHLADVFGQRDRITVDILHESYRGRGNTNQSKIQRRRLLFFYSMKRVKRANEPPRTLTVKSAMEPLVGGGAALKKARAKKERGFVVVILEVDARVLEPWKAEPRRPSLVAELALGSARDVTCPAI